MKKVIIVVSFVMILPLCALERNIFQIIENQDLQALMNISNDIKQINAVNLRGDTPLMIAARIGNVKMVKILINAGADVNGRNRGFTVDNYVRSYLRRTGESRKQTEAELKRNPVMKETLDGYRRSCDALGATPERIDSWNEILKIINEHRQKSSKQTTVPDNGFKSALAEIAHVEKKELQMSDLYKIFGSLAATSNALHLTLKDKELMHWAIFNRKDSRNLKGDEKFTVPAGESFNLGNKNSKLIMNPVKIEKNDEMTLWKYDVDFKYMETSREGNIAKIRNGILCARKSTAKKIILCVK